jgi:uncharacterized protein
MRQSGEPSVEEILASIKQVIARDNRSEAADRRKDRESRGIAQPEGGNDDIDEEFEGHEEDDILDLGTSAELADEEQDEAPAETAPLVNPEARISMRESLAALAMLAEPGAQPQIVRSGETSLEGLARELLRPALAEWLDKNLPPLVERMVATEIARIVGKRG